MNPSHELNDTIWPVIEDQTVYPQSQAEGSVQNMEEKESDSCSEIDNSNINLSENVTLGEKQVEVHGESPKISSPELGEASITPTIEQQKLLHPFGRDLNLPTEGDDAEADKDMLVEDDMSINQPFEDDQKMIPDKKRSFNESNKR